MFHTGFAFKFQIQHPRVKLNRFDMVVTPQHDYYPLTPAGQQQIPRFLRSWITPYEPPNKHVVSNAISVLIVMLKVTLEYYAKWP